jgi:hypothetical protein
VVLYNLWAFRKYLKRETLGTKVFWSNYVKSSKWLWLWSGLFLVSVSLIVGFSPDTATAITQLTGLDLTDNSAAYFTFGLGVCSLADTQKK